MKNILLVLLFGNVSNADILTSTLDVTDNFKKMSCVQRIQKMQISHNSKNDSYDVELHMFYTSFLDGLPLSDLGLQFRKPSIWDRVKHHLGNADLGIVKFSIPATFCRIVSRTLPDIMTSSQTVFDKSGNVIYLSDDYDFILCDQAQNIPVEFASASYSLGKIKVDARFVKNLEVKFLTQLVRHSLVSRIHPTSLSGDRIAANGNLQEVDGQLARVVEVQDDAGQRAFEVRMNSYAPVFTFASHGWKSQELYPLWISYESCSLNK